VREASGQLASLLDGLATHPAGSADSPFDLHEPAEGDPDAVGERAEARAAGDGKDVARIEMVREIEELNAQVGATMPDGKGFVRDEIDCHEGRQYRAVRCLGVQIPRVDHRVGEA
jgi:hypothetical protein